MVLRSASWYCNLQFSIALVFLLSSSLFFAPARSRPVNITVDDTFGDPTTGAFPEYSPEAMWNAGSSTEDCPSCFIGPSILDLTQIHNKTWHDTTYLSGETPTTITIRFTGSAVYVFNILPNTLPNTVTLADISFSLDGQDAGRFVHSPDPSSTILYDQLVYRNTALDNGPHTLVMTLNSNSLVLFDYFLYTIQEPDITVPESTSNSGSPPSSSISSQVLSTSTPQSTSSGTPSSTSTTSPTGSSQSSSPSTPTSTSTSNTSVRSSSSPSTLTSTSTSSSNGAVQFPPPSSSPSDGPSVQTPSPRSRTPVGTIAGLALGVAAILGITTGAFFLYRRRARSRARELEANAYETRHAGGGGTGGGGGGGGGGEKGGGIAAGGGCQAGGDHRRTSLSPPRTWSSATLTSFPADGATAHNSPDLESSYSSDVSGPLLAPARSESHPSPVSPQATEWSSERRAELSRRLNALQLTRSALTTPAPSDRGARLEGTGSEGSRATETAIRELEAEIAQLRVALAAVNARLSDGHVGHLEPLPAYAE